jgi:glycosyltransferase involved in cell wall biosynthesis
LLEAMAAGIPAVAMNVGGVGEAVVDGSTGLLVPSGDLDGFVAAVGTLASDAARRQRMSAAAVERAHASFSSESCADRHVAAFQHALDRAGGRAAFVG